MTKEELKNQIYARIDELPALPAAIVQLMELLEDQECPVSSITQVISQDPALTGKLLKVANSAYYGFSGQIATLDRAVALLGLNMVKSLALSIGVVHVLPQKEKKGAISLQGLWLHSVAVATVCKELADRLQPGGEHEHLFVVGLLHDVGKILMLHFFPDQFQEALDLTNQPEGPRLHLSESQVIGLDHGQVGAMLLKRWKFPRQVVAPILGHHLHAPAAPDLSRDVALIRVANAVTQQLGVGSDGNIMPPPVEPEDLEILEMGVDELVSLEEFVNDSKEGIYNFFNAMI